MDPEVKKEAEEEEDQSRATSREAANRKSDQAEDFPLAIPLSTIYSSKSKKKSTFEKRENASKIKKCVSETVMKNMTLDHGGKCKSSKKNNASTDGKWTQPKSAAMIRAEEVQSNLEASFPSFAKSMVRSHVGSCFWMGLPGLFCKSHLPNKDTVITLEDESGKQYETKYIADKTGLSAGWRQFVSGNNLVEGDVLVFQLVEPTKFKVYIIRANDLTEVDGALGLLTLDANTKNDAELCTPPCISNAKRKRPKSLPLTIMQKKTKKSTRPQSSPKIGHPAEQSENDSEEVGSEVLEGYKLSVPTIQFKDIKSFENFAIVVYGSVLDSEISEDIRNKYYKLCCSQNAFLHESLIHSISSKLIAGIISETVSIADAIRACKLTTSKDELTTWDKTLKAFELLGMTVGFLRARLSRIISLAYDSESATETRRYIEAKRACACADDDIRALEERLVKLKGDCERLVAEIDSLESKAESYEVKFQEEVSAPW